MQSMQLMYICLCLMRCKALQHLYDGPFQVLKHDPKFITLAINE